MNAYEYARRKRKLHSKHAVPTDAFLIRVLGVAGDSAPEENQRVAGRWLESFDNNARGGRGSLSVTHDADRAKRFMSFTAAMSAYLSPSTIRPLRDDMKPNRPLTAYNIEVIKWKST